MSTVYHRPADPSGDDSYVRPLFADRCQAGFPSPATDYAEQELDLNSYCISRPAAAKWHLNRSQFGIRIDHDLASISDHSLASQSITIWHASDH